VLYAIAGLALGVFDTGIEETSFSGRTVGSDRSVFHGNIGMHFEFFNQFD
jgi:hypothetical protein